MRAARQQTSWRREAGRRIRSLWLLKLTGLPLFMAAFFYGYFRVMEAPAYPVTVMPLTVLDRWIGFTPAAIFAYASLWLYVSIPPALMDDAGELVVYGLGCAGLCLIGLSIFCFWPTEVPRAAIDWSGHLGFERLKSIDESGNACPSLHVTFAVFSAAAIGRLLRRMAAPPALSCINAAWCGVIVYSTLATKQHVALDVYAGAALGFAGALAYPSLEARILRRRNFSR